jgi:predicted glycosyltransferase
MSARVLIAVTHLLGIGHLVRARHLAGALAAAGYQVTLASGGMPDGKPAAGYRFVQLPPVRTQGTDFRTLLDEGGAAVGPERLAARREALIDLAREIRPQVAITEHFPFGRRQLAAEFLALIETVRAMRPETLVLSSIRDVLVAPRAERIAQTGERIATLFDAVLVHGDRDFLPLDASWPVTPALAAKLVYTGYLASGFVGRVPKDESSGDIVVSGGGSAAGLALFEAVLAAAPLLPERSFHLLVGGGVEAARFAALEERAPANVRVERARSDFPDLLAGCALSISQAGYNTVLDLVQAGRPALVAPFDEGSETEQTLRAEALAQIGLARRIDLAQGPRALAAAIGAALSAGPAARPAIDLDGARGTVGAIGRLLAGRV